jgi:hypothetical protein
VTNPTASRLSLGLHGGGARKTLIEYERLKAILGTEGVNAASAACGLRGCTGRATY